MGERMGERMRCAAESRERQEPMIGTASRVTAWLLLEQPGPWGPGPVIDSHLERWLSAALLRRAKDHRVRMLLIRQPGWRKPAGPVRCYLAHSGRSASWLEALDLDGPAELADIDWTSLRRETPPGLGTPVREPLYLVCTHGRHDPCCADHGRPLVAALVDAGVAVWESSHVGGDRFAGNLVCLPEGVYFGRVGPDAGPGLVADYEAGLLRLEHFRGRSCHPPLVQAAELAVREAAAAPGRHDLVLESVVADADDSLVATFAVDGGARWVVRVSRRRADEAELLSCHARRSARPWRYEVDLIDSW
jgi:hypothetical protein